MSSLRLNPYFVCFSTFNIVICLVIQPLMSHSSSYCLERNMLTSYIGPLKQTRIGASSVTVPSMGPMRGQYVFNIPKSRNLYTFSIFSYNL